MRGDGGDDGVRTRGGGEEERIVRSSVSCGCSVEVSEYEIGVCVC